MQSRTHSWGRDVSPPQTFFFLFFGRYVCLVVYYFFLLASVVPTQQLLKYIYFHCGFSGWRKEESHRNRKINRWFPPLWLVVLADVGHISDVSVS